MADWRILNNIRCAVDAMLMADIIDKLLEFLDKVIKKPKNFSIVDNL